MPIVTGTAGFENGVAVIHPNDYGEKDVLFGGDYGITYIDKIGKYLWDPKVENKYDYSKCNK